MSRNYISIILVFFCVLTIAEAREMVYTEDALIMEALLGEEAGELTKSRQIYGELYRITGKKEYLLQEAQDTLIQKANPSSSINNLVDWITRNPEDRDAELYRMLVALYIEQGSLTDAENVADEYLSENAPLEDQIAVSTLKLELGKPLDAVRILKRAYYREEDEKILIQLVDTTEKYLRDSKEAIALLEQHIRKHDDTSVGVYFRLIELYSRGKNLNKVEELYKKLYKKDPQKYFLQKIIEISLYKNDIDGVISFLEKNKGNKEILFTFYKEKKRYTKAIILARELYKKDKDPKWLAEEGMLVYENAKGDSKAVRPDALKHMQELLEDALAKGLHGAIYLNYYGYTLIDHDLDIVKGIDLVKKALQVEPTSSYYLDSLAWGLYKKGECARAYKTMKLVVAKEGLSEEEIKTHWDLIRKCYSK